MKKVLVLTAVLVLLVATSVPALAAGDLSPDYGKGQGRQTVFNLVGKITEVNSNGTITVQVVAGNRPVKPYIGKTLVIQTSGATRFLLRQVNDTALPITFGDLARGRAVSVHGVLANSVWTATRVTVGAELKHLP
jgi:hypothetical protein